jgi:hypothetical protein
VSRDVRRGRPALGLGLVALGLLALALSACSTPDATGAPSPLATTGLASTAPTPLGPPDTAAPGATPLVRIDPALLQVLPDSVDGLSVNESTETDAAATTNGSLASLGDSAVGGIAVDPTQGDFVIALVAHLRSNALGDAVFQSWRDTYDQGVCAGSGVVGKAQSDIGGRTVYVGTCGNGIHTYYTWIPARQLLISASSGGSRRLGELLFQTLRV